MKTNIGTCDIYNQIQYDFTWQQLEEGMNNSYFTGSENKCCIDDHATLPGKHGLSLPGFEEHFKICHNLLFL